MLVKGASFVYVYVVYVEPRWVHCSEVTLFYFTSSISALITAVLVQERHKDFLKPILRKLKC